MSDQFDAQIRVVGALHRLPFALVKAIVSQESNFDPRATRQEPQIHDFSAGLMQILLGTARSMGYTGTSGQPSDLSGIYDPPTNLEYGCRWLSHCLTLAGNPAGCASSYNGGWRPALGFGRPASHDLTICLAHDQDTGECIKHQSVKSGEYANQSYVASVLAKMTEYGVAA